MVIGWEFQWIDHVVEVDWVLRLRKYLNQLKQVLPLNSLAEEYPTPVIIEK